MRTNEWDGKTPYNQTKTEKPQPPLEALLRNPHNYMGVRKHAIMLIDHDGHDYGPIGPDRRDEAEYKAREYGWPDYRIVDAPEAAFHDGIGWTPEWVEAEKAGNQSVTDEWRQMRFVDEAAADEWIRNDPWKHTLFWDGVIEYLEKVDKARGRIGNSMLDHIRSKLDEAYAACFDGPTV